MPPGQLTCAFGGSYLAVIRGCYWDNRIISDLMQLQLSTIHVVHCGHGTELFVGNTKIMPSSSRMLLQAADWQIERREKSAGHGLLFKSYPLTKLKRLK
jgi:hypothetical protein